MDNVIIAIKSIVYDKETKKLLILKRSNYKLHNAYLWDFIGGSLEEGEKSNDALKREGYEEIKIKLKHLHSLDFHANPAIDEKITTFVFGLYICDDFEFEIDNKPQLSHEHTEYKWISLDELDNYDFIYSIAQCKDKIRPFIERYYN